MYLAERLTNLRPSPTLSLAEKAARLKQQGKPVIALSVGETDFPTPTWVIEAAHQAALQGQTRYTPVGGTPQLKQAIVNKFSRENNLRLAPDEVMASTGGKQIIFNALLATLNAGDEVIIPAPYWVSYPDIVGLCGGTPVTINCSQARNFKLSAQQLEQAITPRTKWLILNAPSNPTGTAYSYDELWQLAQVVRRHPHIMVMSDDIYEHLVYGQQPFNTIADVEPEIKGQTLTINGVSKSYAMTGWRIGYCAGPRALIEAMTNIQSQSTSNPCSIAQAAALAALEGPQEFLTGWKATYQARRDLMVGLLNDIPGLDCPIPDGAFYLFPSCLPYLGKVTPEGEKLATDIDLSNYLLEQANLAVVPGSAFGSPGYLRLSFALGKGILKQAAQQLGDALQHLK